jgi:hypothetical protein
MVITNDKPIAQTMMEIDTEIKRKLLKRAARSGFCVEDELLSQAIQQEADSTYIPKPWEGEWKEYVAVEENKKIKQQLRQRGLEVKRRKPEQRANIKAIEDKFLEDALPSAQYPSTPFGMSKQSSFQQQSSRSPSPGGTPVMLSRQASSKVQSRSTSLRDLRTPTSPKGVSFKASPLSRGNSRNLWNEKRYVISQFAGR